MTSTMTSTVTLYRVDFSPQKNAWVDNIEDYLTTIPKLAISDFQYVKHNLDLNIKVDISQNEINDFNYNYVAIKNQNDFRTYYYFIVNNNWLSTSTINLHLSLDTINTFQNKLQWDERTNVIRQHMDRFIDPTFTAGAPVPGFAVRNIINKYDEGISGLNKFNDGLKKTIPGTVGKNKWYLIYNSDKNTSTNPDEIVPISCYLCADSDLQLYTGAGAVKLSYSDLEDKTSRGSLLYVFTAKYNLNKIIRFDGDIYTVTATQSLQFYRSGNNLTFEVIENSTAKLKYRQTIANGSVELITANLAITGRTDAIWPAIFEAPIDKDYAWYNAVLDSSGRRYFNAGVENVTIANIKNIDRTLTTIIKIIELPYAPVEFIKDGTHANPLIPNGWQLNYIDLGQSLRYPLLKLNDLTTEFKNNIVYLERLTDYMVTNIPAYDERVRAYKKIDYETKLLNSNFFTRKYIYDTFSKEIKFEDIEWEDRNTATPALYIDFKPSNTMVSNLLFDFQYIDATVRYSEDYGNIMIASRNNEYPIYNSSYINYLRTGYQYDLQRNANAKEDQWAAFGFGVAGTAAAVGASLLPGGQAVGLAASMAMGINTLQTIRNNIDSSLQADERVKQALDQARHQSASIAGSSDLNLFDYYNGNKLQYVNYSVSEKTKQNIYDLFYYTGYAVNKQMTPNNYSRRAFNFIQCDPVFVTENELEIAKYIDDIKARYKAGVTYYHPFYDGDDIIYDFAQVYENWETWICDPKKPQ